MLRKATREEYEAVIKTPDATSKKVQGQAQVLVWSIGERIIASRTTNLSMGGKGDVVLYKVDEALLSGER